MANTKTFIPAIKSLKLVYCLVAFVVFVGGIAIYALFRNIDHMVLFRYFPKPLFLAVPHIQLNTNTTWGYLFVFNLPHGLWCLSGLLVIRAIWLTNARWRAIYGGTFIMLASSLEILQLSETIFGTFDALDLASYGIAFLLEEITYNKLIRRKIL